MKSTYVYSACITVVQLLITGICNAQTINLTSAPASVVIDGNATEWGSLPYSNSKAKISYTLSNDKNNLYLVLKTNDPVQEGSILGTGITLGINTKGKKSTTYTVTFPMGKSPGEPIGSASQYMYLTQAQIQAKIPSTKYRYINVTGFKDIQENQIGTSNSYGIQVAISYDNAGYLVYEEAIPLTLFHATEADNNKEWAFNIEVNGIVLKAVVIESALGSSVGGKNSNNNPFPNRTGANGESSLSNAPQSDTQLTPAYDFWGKFILAKMP